MSGFTFGNPAGSNAPGSSSEQPASIFGTAGGQQNKPLFGASTSTTPGASIFGGGGTTTPATGTSFGGNSTQKAAGEQQKPLFGAVSGGEQSKGLFGATSGAEQPKSIFGGTPGGGQPKNIFGSTPAGEQQKSLFGSGTGGSGTSTPSLFSQQKPAEQGKSLFGSVGGSSGSGSNTPIFGQQQQQTQPSGEQPKSIFASSTPSGNTTTGLFGNTNTNTNGPSIFGKTPAETNANEPSTTSNIFGGGGGSTSGNIFGGKAPAATTGKQSGTLVNAPSSVFNNPGAAPALTGQGNFSNMAPSQDGESSTPQPNKTQSLFSTTPAGNPPSAVNLFGAKADENKQPEANLPPRLFPPPSTDETGGSNLFRKKDDEQRDGGNNELPKTVFGNVGASSATSATETELPRSLFGPGAPSNAPSLFKKQDDAPPSSAANLFGANKGQQGATENTTSTPSLFGGDKGASSAPSLFGGNKDAPCAPSLFGNKATTTASAPSLFGNKNGTATSAPSLFGNKDNATTSAASLFGNKASTTSSSENPPTAATAAPTGGALFGAGTSTASSQPAVTAATSGASLFGATKPAATGTSTTGAPGAAQDSSRISGKSMDDILTGWSTSLAAHQKTFARLADRVATWDRVIVDNTQKISALYAKCFQAERDVNEVERQLATVEHGQFELEHNLERWESVVDRMLENANLGHGESGGVDAERERTYNAAQSCSQRLTEMSASLTEMIDEINSASTKLSSTRATPKDVDDPLVQIVRVLNGHLAQLQEIDQGAATLQSKVMGAQKEARQLDQGKGLNGAGRWADDFARSYLGRR